MAQHDTDWSLILRQSGRIKFSCGVCGQTVEGDEAAYDAGSWSPPNSHT